MDNYIAAKPVRFDRDYAVGEIIPSEVIDPRMEKRLIALGRIQRVPAQDSSENDENRPDTPPSSITAGSVAFIEEFLGITPDEGQSLEQRADICKARLQELSNPQGEQEETPEGAEASGSGNDTDENLMPSDEQIPPSDGNVQGGTADDAGTASDVSPFTCVVCGKECASKTALTNHAKTHNK